MNSPLELPSVSDMIKLACTITFVACELKEVVDDILGISHQTGEVGGSYTQTFLPLLTLLSRQVEAATGQACHVYDKSDDSWQEECFEEAYWSISGSDSDFVMEELVALTGAIAGIAPDVLDQNDVSKLQNYLNEDTEHYKARVTITSPIYVTTVDDDSWHPPLTQLFQNVLHPRGEESVIFKFTKSQTFNYYVEGFEPLDLQGLRLFLGVTQLIEDPLRDLQIQQYSDAVADDGVGSQVELDDSQRLAWVDDDSEVEDEVQIVRKSGKACHDDVPQGFRDNPLRKGLPDGFLWDRVKQCNTLSELKQMFGGDASARPKLFDLSLVKGQMAIEGSALAGQLCEGYIKCGFPIHRTRLDGTISDERRIKALRNMFHCMQFTLWLYTLASPAASGSRRAELSEWIEDSAASSGLHRYHLADYICNYVAPFSELAEGSEALHSQMARNFLTRVGFKLSTEAALLDDSPDPDSGQENGTPVGTAEAGNMEEYNSIRSSESAQAMNTSPDVVVDPNGTDDVFSMDQEGSPHGYDKDANVESPRGRSTKVSFLHAGRVVRDLSVVSERSEPGSSVWDAGGTSTRGCGQYFMDYEEILTSSNGLQSVDAPGLDASFEEPLRPFYEGAMVRQPNTEMILPKQPSTFLESWATEEEQEFSDSLDSDTTRHGDEENEDDDDTYAPSDADNADENGKLITHTFENFQAAAGPYVTTAELQLEDGSFVGDTTSPLDGDTESDTNVTNLTDGSDQITLLESCKKGRNVGVRVEVGMVAERSPLSTQVVTLGKDVNNMPGPSKKDRGDELVGPHSSNCEHRYHSREHAISPVLQSVAGGTGEPDRSLYHTHSTFKDKRHPAASVALSLSSSELLSASSRPWSSTTSNLTNVTNDFETSNAHPSFRQAPLNTKLSRFRYRISEHGIAVINAIQTSAPSMANPTIAGMSMETGIGMQKVTVMEYDEVQRSNRELELGSGDAGLGGRGSGERLTSVAVKSLTEVLKRYRGGAEEESCSGARSETGSERSKYSTSTGKRARIVRAWRRLRGKA
ncbi:hypothetical protein BDZ91DRAFT_709334 [Kalaharituber pfeilii]|nr:hypothetical protein BDZ91DRAFT_709334 [Kalaharituber pfeilii]